jgi:hypothetical protein
LAYRGWIQLRKQRLGNFIWEQNKVLKAQTIPGNSKSVQKH